MKRLLLILLLVGHPTFAVQPAEILSDSGLETRARAISRDLRCPVCQGESIDDSNAPISRDLRLYVRERLVAGDDDAAVIDAVTTRFGDYVLFEPRARGANLILWYAGPALAFFGMLLTGFYIRSRRGRDGAPPQALSDDETARLARIMADDQDS